jgi:hypothetical protein
MKPTLRVSPPLLGAVAVCVALPAYAYIGPGAGLTAIGTVIALLGGIFLAIVGFVWYPIKRVMRSRARAKTAAAATSPTARPERSTKDGQ